jgi:hypothetical protein
MKSLSYRFFISGFRLSRRPPNIHVAWGISGQITPHVLNEGIAAGGDEAKRAFDAMITMKKIDVAAIEAARRG